MDLVRPAPPLLDRFIGEVIRQGHAPDDTIQVEQQRNIRLGNADARDNGCIDLLLLRDGFADTLPDEIDDPLITLVPELARTTLPLTLPTPVTMAPGCKAAVVPQLVLPGQSPANVPGLVREIVVASKSATSSVLLRALRTTSL